MFDPYYPMQLPKTLKIGISRTDRVHMHVQRLRGGGRGSLSLARVSLARKGKLIGGAAGTSARGSCLSSARSEEGFEGGRGLNSGCLANCIFLSGTFWVLVFMMLHPPKARSHYPVLIKC